MDLPHTVFRQDDTALCSCEKDAKVILYRCLKQQLHYAHACGEEDAARELLPFRRPALGAAALKSFQEKLAENPRVAATMANAEVGDLMPSVPEMSRFWYSFQSALKYSANGRQTVDDALETAAMRISQ